MYPMDFEEFRWALGDKTTIPMLRQIFDSKKFVGDVAHRKIMRDFRMYMLVGGMPQAVEAYIETNDFRKVDSIKRNILELYKDDFRKIDPTGKLSILFEAIPAQLMSNASRYQVSSVIEGSRASKILEQITELKESGVVLVAYHANDPNVGMAQNKDLTRFKLFMTDTGLFTTLVFKDKDYTENDIYKKLLSDKLQANLGYLYENAVAQCLAANGHELYYYTFKKEESKHNYEIDFLISEKNKISPIEVKSSGYNTHPSIDNFSKKYSSRVLNKYLLGVKDYSKDKDLEIYPIYMAQFL